MLLCKKVVCVILLPCQELFLIHMGGFPSGQRGQTVNLLQIASVVRIHLHPFGLRSKSIVQCTCRRGGTGRRTGLKILRDLYSRTGSIPVAGSNM